MFGQVADMEHDSGWGILGSGKFGDNLFRRNFESIRYDVHDKQTDGSQILTSAVGGASFKVFCAQCPKE